MSTILPPALVRRLGSSAGFNAEAFEAVHEQNEQVTAIRINPTKPAPLDTFMQDPVPWCNTGYYVSQQPVHQSDPLFHAGCYTVQEASSMFVAHAIQVLGLDERPLIALDLCAATGRMSTLLNTYLHRESLLIANEPINARTAVLRDHLIRWGNPNTIVTNNDPSAFRHLPGYVDLILVDAPCSGRFRNDPKAITAWSEAAVQLCSERQRRILVDSLPTLKEGGILLYATHSYSIEENEQLADWLCDTQGMEPLHLSVAEAWGIEQTLSDHYACPGYRFYPHKLRGEGFFLTAFRKAGKQPTFDRRKPKPERVPVPALGKWVANANDYFTFTIGEEMHMLPKKWEGELHILRNMLSLCNVGTHIGRMANGALIPTHDLALSSARHTDLPTLALKRDEALNYLRGGSHLGHSTNIQVPIRGVLATYEGAALGWMLPG